MKRLMAAAAMAPLCFAAVSAARAETAISTATTTPVATSTANAGAPDDVHITTTGSITLNSGTAVTLDSDNKVTQEGPIKIEDTATAAGVSGNTGILILGGHTGSLNSSSSIIVDDTVAGTDTNGDGVNDGPFATQSDRYGIRVMGPGVFTAADTTGAITTTGSINVKGNNSAGVSIETGVVGAVSIGGFVSVAGDHSYGVHVGGPVTGDVTILGSVSAAGLGSSAVVVDQAIDGKLTLWNTITSTGYQSITRPTDTSILATVETTPLEVLQGGPAVQVAGDVTGGIVLDLPVSVTDTSGTVTTTGGTGSITTYGSAPALLLGSATAPVHIGLAGTGDDAFGVLLRGNIDAEGVYDNVNTTAIQIGGTGGTVTIDGGIKLSGAVTSFGYNRTDVGLLIGAGASVPEVLIDYGASIAAASLSPAGTFVLPGQPVPTAIAIQITGGAAPLLINYGDIAANIAGDVGNATAILDAAGALRQIVNTGSIRALITPATAGDTTVGSSIAVDLRGNTAGVTVIQSQGAVVSTTDSSGVVTTTTPAAPFISGDVMFGAGDAKLQLLAGSLSGAVSFGTGQNSLTLDNGATMGGKLTNAGGLDLNLINGTMRIDNTEAISLTSLQVGAAGTAYFTVDPTNNAYTHFNVTGAIDLTTGAKLGMIFLSKLINPTTFTLIQAGAGGSVTTGTLDPSLLLTKVPYFYVADLNVTQGAGGSVVVDVRRRTAAEAGLNVSETKALDAVFNIFDHDAGVQAAFFSAGDRASFKHLFDQMLPDYSGGAFQAFTSAMGAVSRAESEAPLKLASNTGRGWVQEIGFQARRSTEDSQGYRSSGFGVVGGIERPDTGLGAIGLSGAFLTTTVKQPDDATDAHLIASSAVVGVYWRAGDPNQGLRLDAGVHGGYSWFGDQRILRLSDPTTGADVLNRQAKTSWSGAIVAAHVGVSYEEPFGRYYVRPQVMADYVYLYEGAHTERGGGDAFNLQVNSRNSGQASAEADAVFGARFGTNLRWGPEIKVGWREVMGKGPGDTTATYLGGGTPFTLSAQALDKGGLVARGALRGGDQYADFAVEAGGEGRGDYRSYDARVVARFLF